MVSEIAMKARTSMVKSESDFEDSELVRVPADAMSQLPSADGSGSLRALGGRVPHRVQVLKRAQVASTPRIAWRA
ncbi:hypothetical protein BN2476_1590013 [Paraburkholderia piptadeniae]|uniref:Uncharacterized protein n=1 Tax=Paraburkholderia piptadeniae TaxID=1701573 RepID=A0A1N7SX95_9BURK|nr:hypothetical protein BN2476_1590013 [Paraburkholderia piptadeniae]